MQSVTITVSGQFTTLCPILNFVIWLFYNIDEVVFYLVTGFYGRYGVVTEFPPKYSFVTVSFYPVDFGPDALGGVHRDKAFLVGGIEIRYFGCCVILFCPALPKQGHHFIIADIAAISVEFPFDLLAGGYVVVYEAIVGESYAEPVAVEYVPVFHLAFYLVEWGIVPCDIAPYATSHVVCHDVEPVYAR